MTTLSQPASRVNDVHLTWWTGQICLWSGLLGAASGLFLAFVPTSVDEDLFRYPLSVAGFVAIQAWFFFQHLGLIAGLAGLQRLNIAGGHRAGLRLAIWGMALLAVIELLAIAATDSTYPGKYTGSLDAGYGISTTVIGIGLVMAGIAAYRAHVLDGWERWMLLILGVYVFVPMFPLMFAGFLGARIAITGWMLLFALAGWVVARHASAA